MAEYKRTPVKSGVKKAGFGDWFRRFFSPPPVKGAGTASEEKAKKIQEIDDTEPWNKKKPPKTDMEKYGGEHIKQMPKVKDE